MILSPADLWPKSSVDLVSDSLYDDGEQQMTMVVLQFPPSESWRILVILLSRYGTYVYADTETTARQWVIKINHGGNHPYFSSQLEPAQGYYKSLTGICTY